MKAQESPFYRVDSYLDFMLREGADEGQEAKTRTLRQCAVCLHSWQGRDAIYHAAVHESKTGHKIFAD